MTRLTSGGSTLSSGSNTLTSEEEDMGLTYATNTVATDENLSGGSGFTDLATSGPAVTVTVNTAVMVTVSCDLFFSANNGYGYMGVALSGANTVAASANKALGYGNGSAGSGADFSGSKTFLHTGLTPGSTTFTAKYDRGGGSGTTHWVKRDITVALLD